MAPQSHRETAFPGSGQVGHLKINEEKVNTNRRTRFPQGIGIQRFSLQGAVNMNPDKKVATRILQPLPLKISPPNEARSKPYPDMDIQTSQRDEPPNVISESPWSSYTALRTLERGGEVTAACTQKEPVKMVAIKKLSFDHFGQYARYQHRNLLVVIEAYRYEGIIYAITDYTAATLKQVIAIPLPLTEIHISATCRQESFL